MRVYSRFNGSILALGVAAALFTGLLIPRTARGSVYVTNYVGGTSGTIGEYTNSGATVNASLVSGLDYPLGIAVSGSDLFVANEGNGTIGEYTTSGATVNASLVSGLNFPEGIAVSGSDLFVTSFGNHTIGEYTTSGATVNASLVSGLLVPYGIAVSGSDLFVAIGAYNTIGEYTTSGATVNASLVSVLDGTDYLAVDADPVPEPSALGLVCLLAMWGLGVRRPRRLV